MIKNSYYKNGQIKKEVKYVDNIKNGRIRWYYPNGELKGIGFYNDGRCDGDFITYYRSGKIKSRVKYINGEPISLIEYFENEPPKKKVRSEKKIEREIKEKNSNKKKFLIVSLILISGLIYSLFNLLNENKKEIAKLSENKKNSKIVKDTLKNSTIMDQQKKEEKGVQEEKKIKNIESENISLDKDKKKLDEKNLKKSNEGLGPILEISSIEKIDQNKILTNTFIAAEELDKIKKSEIKVQELNREQNILLKQIKEEDKESKTKKDISTITKLQEIQKQNKLKENRNTSVQVQEKKNINQQKNEILREIKTTEVNFNYESKITPKEREEVLKGIMKPKYDVYVDKKYGYKFVYPYNIIKLSNFQTKYLKGQFFNTKGGYLIGRLVVISSDKLKELRAYNIQQLFENELRSKYSIIEKKLDIKNGKYEIKFQMNNKYLERYVLSSKNGDYYLFLTIEYNKILEKDLKKIIKKMKKELEAN